MHEAALAEGAGKAGLDGADQSGRAVADDEERIGQAAPLEVLEERGGSWPCPPWCPAPGAAGPSGRPR
jgi:hypothetical protein